MTVALIPVLATPARVLGLVDNPCHRKRHEGQIPLTGGLAMFLAFLAALIFQWSWLPSLASLLMGMGVMLAVGLTDDLIDVRPLYRLAWQVLAATVFVLFSGLEVIQMGQLFGTWVGPIGMGPFSEVFTVACVVFLINAINMSDGMDGLAGGICFFTLLMLGLLGWMDGASPMLVLVSFTVALSVLGFLLFNIQTPWRSRASAFMGDAGSMMLGFAIAWLAIAIATAEGSTVYPISIAWLLLVPAMDTLAVSVRRIRQGRSPMSADRCHLHHILHRSGWSNQTTVRIVHLLVLLSGAIGVLGWWVQASEGLMFGLAALVMLGYMQFLARAHRFLRWRQRRLRIEELVDTIPQPPSREPIIQREG
ncbi:MAG: MraY family glycosyltransferase [Pseudomonadota bacterium]